MASMDWSAEGLLAGLDDGAATARARQLDALPEAAGYEFTEAGMKRFKGIADPVGVLRLRPAADDD